MLKKISLLLMVSMLLLVSGCTNDTSTTGNYDPFVGGDQGLVMSFITGSPPDEVFDNNQYPFSVSVKVDNKGEFPIEDNSGFLEIKGISPDEFGVSLSDLKLDLTQISGAKKNSDGSILEGQSDVFTFDDLVYLQNLAGNLPIENFRVRACYDYETDASSQLCVKENGVDGLKDNEVCLINEQKRIVNSGAPIQVTNIAETSKGKSGIQVTFDVAHVGPLGNKWFPTGDNECDDSIDNKNLYKVEVEVDSIVNGKYSAECSGGTFNGGNNGEITLFSGESRKVICSFDVGEQSSDFETQVNINLKYRYLQHIEKQLLIKDLGNDE